MRVTWHPCVVSVGRQWVVNMYMYELCVVVPHWYTLFYYLIASAPVLINFQLDVSAGVLVGPTTRGFVRIWMKILSYKLNHSEGRLWISLLIPIARLYAVQV